MTGVIWSTDDIWEQFQSHAGDDGSNWVRVDSRESLNDAIEREAATIAVLEEQVIEPPVDRLVQHLTTRAPQCAVCVLLHQPFVDRAADLMRAGATDVSLNDIDEETYRRISEADTVPGTPTTEAQVDSSFLLNEVRTSLERGNLRRAQTLIRRVLAGEPDNPSAFNLLGVVAERLGEVLLAQKYYRAALDLEPEFEAARTNLERTTTHDDTRPPVVSEPEGPQETGETT